MKVSFFKTAFVCLIAAGVLLTFVFVRKTSESSGLSEVAIPDSPDAAVQTVLSEFAKGDSSIVWRALPKSYQSDVNELVHLLGSSADEEVYDKSFSLIGDLAEIIDKQQSFIVNSSLVQDRSPDNLAQLEAVLPSIAGLINTIASSELSTIEGLKQFDGKVFFKTTVSRCVDYLKVIGQLTGEETKLADYASIVVSVVETDGNQVTLSIAVPGQEKREEVFIKVEERWVPVELENDWDETIGKMASSIQSLSAKDSEAQKKQIMGALAMFEGIMNQIVSAKTQEQFDQSLKESAMSLMGIFMMLSQAVGSSN